MNEIRHQCYCVVVCCCVRTYGTWCLVFGHPFLDLGLESVCVCMSVGFIDFSFNFVATFAAPNYRHGAVALSGLARTDPRRFVPADPCVANFGRRLHLPREHFLTRATALVATYLSAISSPGGSNFPSFRGKQNAAEDLRRPSQAAASPSSRGRLRLQVDREPCRAPPNIGMCK